MCLWTVLLLFFLKASDKYKNTFPPVSFINLLPENWQSTVFFLFGSGNSLIGWTVVTHWSVGAIFALSPLKSLPATYYTAIVWTSHKDARLLITCPQTPSPSSLRHLQSYSLLQWNWNTFTKCCPGKCWVCKKNFLALSLLRPIRDSCAGDNKKCSWFIEKHL